MRLIIHLNGTRKVKTYDTARSIIHYPAKYVITWVEFDGKEAVLKKDTFLKKDVKWISIH